MLNNGITPQTVRSNIRQTIEAASQIRKKARDMIRKESGASW